MDDAQFVGPPFHSMPLADVVDYKATSFFFNVTHYSSWMTDAMEWDISPTERQGWVQESRWWCLDQPVRLLD